MFENPLVSVVIPAYNSSKWIAETLESVLAQDYAPFEVIVVDDGSTDNTADVVRRFGERVRYVFKPNGGQGSARNVGIREAHGAFIAFVDSDDLWAKKKLQLQVELLTKTALLWAYSDVDAFDNDSGNYLYSFSTKSKQYDGDVLGPLFLSCFIQSPAPIVHRKIFEDVGYFDESKEIKNREDWDMWLRISTKYPICRISKPLAYYRVHTSSMTGGENPILRLNSHLAVIEKIVRLAPEVLMPLKDKRIASCYIEAGLMLVLASDLKQARTMFKVAIKLKPTCWSSYAYWMICLFGKTIVSGLIREKKLLATHFRRFNSN